MKMCRSLYIIFLSYCAPFFAIPLPAQFCVLDQKKVCPRTVNKGDYYVVLVPDGEAPVSDLLAFTDKNNLALPVGFFGLNHPSHEKKPVFLYFSWKKTHNIQHHSFSTHAKVLSQGISQLCAQSSACIIVTHNAGSLLLNKASQSGVWKNKPLVVQIGTPIPKDIKIQYSFLPSFGNIAELYSFYSDYPFSVSTLSHKAQNMYMQSGIQSGVAYQIQTFINNNIPQQDNLFGQVLGATFLSVIQEIKKHYALHRNLAAHLTTKGKNVFVTIKKTLKTPKNSAIKQRWQAERTYSDLQKKMFQTAYHKPMVTGFSTREQLRAKYRTV